MFTDGDGFAYMHPMKSKSQAGEALNKVTLNVGVPNCIISDGAKEETEDNMEFVKALKRCHIDNRTTEPYSPWQNKAENVIGIIKGKAKRRRIRRRVPKRCWDFGLVWEAEIYCRTAGKDERTALERVTGDSTDISEWLEFEFYDLCWYWDNQQDTKEAKIGRWLGVSHRVGSALCYWILTEKGQILSRTTVQHVTREEVQNPEIQQAIREYHNTLYQVIGAEEFVSDIGGLSDFVNDDVDAGANEDEDVLE
jgi:hypothetical protein